MSWVGHLVELRNRVYIAVFSLIPGTILGFIFSGQIIHFLRSPLPTDAPLQALGLTDAVRFEHHVTEAYKSIVRQPYERRAELVTAAATVANLSAKHEGGEPVEEAAGEHPSDIFDYFLSRDEIERRGLMSALEAGYLAKHAAVNHTADELTRAGIGVRPATRLHAPGPAPPRA